VYAKLFQHLSDMLDVFFLSVGEDEDVVQIHHKEIVLVGVKDMIHEVLEASRSIGETESHDQHFEVA
jgi:hypothetical protein